MREITFRGKRLDNGQWVYGSLVVDYHGRCFIHEYKRENIDIILTVYEVNPATVGQYTGLKDESGREIYEGDIMGIPHKYPNRFTRVVEWINDGFFLIDNCEGRKYGDRLELEISLNSNYDGVARCLKDSGYKYEIIGNIHDNPELMEIRT